MAFTQDELNAIERAIAIGALTVEYSDGSGSHRTTYRSLEDMLRVRDLIRRTLDPSAGARSPIHVTYDRGIVS